MIKYDIYIIDAANKDTLICTTTNKDILTEVVKTVRLIISMFELSSSVVVNEIKNEEKSMKTEKTEYDVYVVDINNNEVLVDTFDDEDVAINVSRSIRKLKDLLDKDYLPQTNILSAYYERVKDKEV